MKSNRNPLFAGIILLFCGLAGNAQIIYSNAFNGGAVNIHGTAPTVANDFAGGASFARWNDVLGHNNTGVMLANGANSTTLGDSWLLPFAPQHGYVYTLTASLTFTGSPGNWVGLGFAEYDPVNLFTGSRYADNFVTGYDHIILTESSGNVQYFSGPRGNSPPIYNANSTFTANTPQIISVQVILNTTGSLWSIAANVNGVQMGSPFTYVSNPSIGAVGINQTGLGAPANYRWNNLSLQAVGAGPTTNTVNATVSFPPANAGVLLNPTFKGLSYEKLSITNATYFTSNDVTLVHLFSQIGPGIVRIGGGTVDTTGWNGISNTVPITAAYVDRFAGFMKALPTNWSVIYGINYVQNTPANCAAEAAYVANALGSRLYGFEIGNEPEYYPGFNYSAFLVRYRSLAAAITNNVPGWAVTNNGIGWTFDDADAGQGQLAAITDPFARDESEVVSLLTQHYYVAAGGSPSDTMQLLLQQPDLTMRDLVTNIVGAATGRQTLGARITETASYSAGGVQGVSDVYGAALWSLDYMFTAALNGLQGVNFHGGWISPYSPIIDNGIGVQRVGPELYGLKMLSLLPRGNVVSATVTLSSNINFTAYGIRCLGGGISALLNNKDTSNRVVVAVNLGTNVSGAQMIALTGPSLFSSSVYTIGGAPIDAADGTWNGGVQAVLSATNGQLTVVVPPISAILLNPVLVPPIIATSIKGSQLTLSWPTNYIGWLLQSNSIGLLGTNWFSLPDSGNTNRAQITIQPGLTNMFYRLFLP